MKYFYKYENIYFNEQIWIKKIQLFIYIYIYIQIINIKKIYIYKYLFKCTNLNFKY